MLYLNVKPKAIARVSARTVVVELWTGFILPKRRVILHGIHVAIFQNMQPYNLT
jgi:hypothetical protein